MVTRSLFFAVPSCRSMYLMTISVYFLYSTTWWHVHMLFFFSPNCYFVTPILREVECFALILLSKKVKKLGFMHIPHRFSWDYATILCLAISRARRKIKALLKNVGHCLDRKFWVRFASTLLGFVSPSNTDGNHISSLLDARFAAMIHSPGDHLNRPRGLHASGHDTAWRRWVWTLPPVAYLTPL